jgi:hypothetical protein
MACCEVCGNGNSRSPILLMRKDCGAVQLTSELLRCLPSYRLVTNGCVRSHGCGDLAQVEQCSCGRYPESRRLSLIAARTQSITLHSHIMARIKLVKLVLRHHTTESTGAANAFKFKWYADCSTSRRRVNLRWVRRKRVGLPLRLRCTSKTDAPLAAISTTELSYPLG